MSIPLHIAVGPSWHPAGRGSSGSPLSEEKGLEILGQQQVGATRNESPSLLSANELDGIIASLLSWNGAQPVANRDLMNGKALGCLSEKLLQSLCTSAEPLFAAEPALLELAGPVTIVGNLYSHLHDLQRILRLNGLPPRRKYLFLGNVVTRGAEGIETLALLLALKIRHPQHIFILRGNSETRDAARVFGFYEQCKQKVSLRQWRRFSSLFTALPLAATVDHRVLCAAGGIGATHLAAPSTSLVAQLLGGASVTRPGADLPETGALRELVAGPGDHPSAAALSSGLLQPHGLHLLVTDGRASDHGFRVVSSHHVALFSATEAVDEDNPAAVLHLEETQPEIRYSVQRYNPQPRAPPHIPSLSSLCARLIATLEPKSQERVSLPTELRDLIRSDGRACAAPCCSRPRFFHEPIRTPEDSEVCSVHCYSTRWQQPASS